MLFCLGFTELYHVRFLTKFAKVCGPEFNGIFLHEMGFSNWQKPLLSIVVNRTGQHAVRQERDVTLWT